MNSSIEPLALKDFLDHKADQYNNPDFIPSDPVSIPHIFEKKEDIEISGFLTATISWGRRQSILNNAKHLLDLMDNTPHDFLVHASDSDISRVRSFVHRTFNGSDCVFFLKALKYIYERFNDLESAFLDGYDGMRIESAITGFRDIFLSTDHLPRAEKHLADPSAGSSAKRINMFLRWMVRDDRRGVDFGLWKGFSPSILMCPLDVHSGNAARKLGLLVRKANDWKAVTELTENLRLLDPADPVKYDYALFGIGVHENF